MRFLLALSLALVIGKSCDATYSPIHFPGQIQPRSSKLTADTISKGFTKFTLDLDKAIDEISNNEVKNVVLSPASLTATLAILLLGSSGGTFNEISKALHVDSVRDIYENSENVHIALGKFMRSYIEKKPTLNQTIPIFKASTGLFIQDGYPFRKEFIKASRGIYGGDVINVDFAQHNENAQNVINQWTNSKTLGKIPIILSEPPSEDTRVIVSSAIYFNGMWDKEFESIHDRYPFEVESGETIHVSMMTQTTTFPYFEIKNQLQILGLPYIGLETVMYVIRPHDSGTNGLRKLKRQLTPEFLDNLIQKMKNTEVDVGIPKMKLSSNVNLQEALSALNLTSLFHPTMADFTIISPGLEEEFVLSNPGNPEVARDFGIDKLRRRPSLRNPKLFLERITHAVNLQINEKGTVATASTMAVMSTYRALRPMFYANKPFLFFIRHNPTKSILFWGSINRPTNE